MSKVELFKLYEEDDWGRPLYKDKDRNYYCDVNLGNTEIPDIHFKGGREDEPYYRVTNFSIKYN